MARKITTVTHPDGTVSRRTSERADYQFAVVVTEAAETLALEEDARADLCRAEAEALQAALADGTVTTTTRPWSGGGAYVDVSIGGAWAAGGVDCPAEGKAAPTEAEALAKLAEQITSRLANAAWHDERAAAHRAGAPTRYRVVRWSARAANAYQAARGEFGTLNRPGCSVDVVGVDA